MRIENQNVQQRFPIEESVKDSKDNGNNKIKTTDKLPTSGRHDMDL